MINRKSLSKHPLSFALASAVLLATVWHFGHRRR